MRTQSVFLQYHGKSCSELEIYRDVLSSGTQEVHWWGFVVMAVRLTMLKMVSHHMPEVAGSERTPGSHWERSQGCLGG